QSLVRHDAHSVPCDRYAPAGARPRITDWPLSDCRRQSKDALLVAADGWYHVSRPRGVWNAPPDLVTRGLTARGFALDIPVSWIASLYPGACALTPFVVAHERPHVRRLVCGRPGAAVDEKGLRPRLAVNGARRQYRHRRRALRGIAGPRVHDVRVGAPIGP